MARHDVILCWTASDGQHRSVSFHDVPGTDRSLIVFQELTGCDVANQIDKLVEELRLELRAISSGEEEGYPCPDLDSIETDRHALLLVIAADSPKEAPDSSLDTWILHAKRSGDEQFRLMPILNRKLDPYKVLPKSLQPYNIGFWTVDIRELSQEILAASGIASEDYRVFISYRQLDCLQLAEQLYLELTKHRFQVFLDRFTIPPGVDFQDRLGTELEDKSMVVIIESKRLLKSEWVLHEIAFAKNRKLGVLSLHFPKRPKVANVEDSNRFELPLAKLKRPPRNPAVKKRRGMILSKDALDEVVREIKRQHNLALFRRRQSMRENFVTAIRSRTNAVPTLLADGIMQVAIDQRLYNFWLTPRPPELVDYHNVVHRGLPLPTPFTEASVAIIGPSINLRQSERGCLEWVGGLCKARQYDEQDLEDLANRLAEGDIDG